MTRAHPSLTLPPLPPPSGGVSREPTVEQWARAQAMHGVTRMLAGSMRDLSQAEARRIDDVTERWARYILTGRWDA